ncbi:shikimate kinase [Rufibacter sp. XAAS-G3-1]|uniref:shikimate kinase n=1 Tax=Rufibacter sp. XAAS-G3-1 TaxID=2729134 RepID=UPI0015E7D318|nr:shikimate kinase [Rufibacter sp. XAAS-G3-1]
MSSVQSSAASKIFLVGMPGCGKSTVGKVLAGQLNYQFLDLDTLIEEQEGMSVPEVFKQRGQAYFRAAEAKALRLAAERTGNVVLATGGGAPCFGGNMDFMVSHGIPVYLKLSPQDLVSRLSTHDLQLRPLLQDKSPAELQGYLAGTLAERERFYLRAPWVLPAGEGAAQAVAQSIARLLFPR